jgi:hypothetical protein
MAFGIVSIPATRLEVQSAGAMGLSLTHFDDTAECQVAAGSWCEIAGAVYEADADTAIVGWGGIASDSEVYIKLVVAAGAVTPTFTTTAPTWDAAKCGYYNGADRYVGGLYKDSAGNYATKWLYTGRLDNGMTRPFLRKRLQIGTWDMVTTATKSVAHGLPQSRILRVDVIILSDAGSGAAYRSLGWAGAVGYNGIAAGDVQIGATNLDMTREDGMIFDSANFNDGAMNRGWILVDYVG